MGCGAASIGSARQLAKYEEAAIQEPIEKVPTSPAVATKAIAAVLSNGKLDDFYDTVHNPRKHGAHAFRLNFKMVVNKITKKTRSCRAVDKQSVELADVKQEVEIYSLLDHPNILQLYEVFSGDRLNFYFIEMYCRGGRLFDQLIGKSEEPVEFSWNEPLVSSIVKQVLTGVNYMHMQRVCHRNLDFQRLMLLEDVTGKDGGKKATPIHQCTVVISDFSLACRFEDGNKMTENITSEAFLPGMAPEALNPKSGGYNELCDIWTCGVFTYMLLSGELPYEGDDALSQWTMISSIDTKSKVYGLDGKAGALSKVSLRAKEFIQALLSRAVGQRCTASGALNLPWITECNIEGTDAESHFRTNGDKGPGISGDDIVWKLRQFHEHSSLRKKALQVIAHRLQDDEISALGKAFLALDTNGDGVVSVKELKDGMLQSKSLKDTTDLKALIDTMNANGNAFLEYSTFLAAVMDEKYYQEEHFCLLAFKYFDKNGDKKISRSELMGALQLEDCSEDVDDPQFKFIRQEVMSSIKKFDGDGDKCIDFDEFMEMMRGATGKVERTRSERKTTSRASKLKKERAASGEAATAEASPTPAVDAAPAVETKAVCKFCVSARSRGLKCCKTCATKADMATSGF